MFVEKCSDKMKEFCVRPDVTFEEVEAVLIKPFLDIMESEASDDEKSATLLEKGFGERGGRGLGEYGLSKAAVNSYTMELGRRFPSLTCTSCSPGFIETDLTRGFATGSGRTPQEMGMLTVDQVITLHDATLDCDTQQHTRQQNNKQGYTQNTTYNM